MLYALSAQMIWNLVEARHLISCPVPVVSVRRTGEVNQQQDPIVKASAEAAQEAEASEADQDLHGLQLSVSGMWLELAVCR